MKNRLLITLILFFVVQNRVNAQSHPSIQWENHDSYANHPEIEAKLLGDVQTTIAKHAAANDTAEYTIPVVVHIIHDYGAEYVPDDSIIHAVSNWDSIFHAQNPDTADVILPFKKYIGNVHIHFRLATKDPNGNPTRGITRHFSYLANNPYVYPKSIVDQKKIGQWPPDKYLNVWLTQSVSPNYGSYSYHPWVIDNSPYYDGVVCAAAYITAYKQVPQRVGRYLGLQYTWGDVNSPGQACGDDGIDDTPPTWGHYTCTTPNLYDTTCATGYVVHYLNVQQQDSIEDYPDTANTQNIMDYSGCPLMFTKGQAAYMRTVLNSNVAGRNNLISIANLTATGALASLPDLSAVPVFSIDKGVYHAPPPFNGMIQLSERSYFLCAGDTLLFTFRDQSWNDTITSVHWHFSNGATISDSTASTQFALSHPIYNQFTQPGWVSVSLMANGNNTAPVTFTDNRAVYAADGNNVTVEDPLHTGMHFMEFTPAQNSKWPIFNYYGNNFKWQTRDDVGFYDQTCIEYTGFDNRPFPENKSGGPRGDYDDFFSTAYDLSNMTNGYCNINFMTAGTRMVDDAIYYKDTFEVSCSINCGKSWISLKKYTGNEIANNGISNIAYEPMNSGEWHLNSIELPDSVRVSRVFFRFRYKPWGDENDVSRGNNFYLDRITISNFPTGVNALLNDKHEVLLAPNPASGDSYVLLYGNDAKTATIRVTDVSGKQICTKTFSMLKSIDKLNIPSDGFRPGVYFVTITSDLQTVTRKLIIAK